MFKRTMIRFINSFCYSIAITLVAQMIAMAITGHIPMLPEYMSRFQDPLQAFAVQLLLIGMMSAITAAGTFVYELKKIGLLTQSLLSLLIMLVVWIPVACFVWGFHRYLASMISTIISIVVTYGITWGINYALCKKEIEDINARLIEKEGKQA